MRILSILLVLLSALHAAEKPNFIVILIDDLGATDIGCYGSKFYETPHIDQLAADGAKFKIGYSACTVCSPTRSAMMTGKYPARTHITDWIPGEKHPQAKLLIPEWQQSLPDKEVTIASLLKNQGYATCAIGKWHLSPAGPTAHGFDVMIADNHIGQPASYLSPYKNPNLPDGPRGEELTARCTEEALGFIEKNQSKPFFLYLAHFAVHTPLGGKPEVIDKYEKKALTMKPQGKPAYAAMIEAVDDSVGRIRAGLEKMNLTKNTVIIFTGDNGGLILRQTTTNLGMRSGKGDAYEGGVRVPFIVLWPGVTKAKTVIDVPVITQDIPTTLAEAAGASMHADGISLMPALTGGTMADRALYWHYPHYHGGGASPYSAIRDDHWKLVHFYENDRDELYNLATDPEEKNDIAIGHEQTKKLRLKLDAWLKETGAQIPQLNPKYQKK